MADHGSSSSAADVVAQDDLHSLFKLLDEFCTLGQLVGLIRVYRPNSADYPINVSNEVALKLILRLYNAGHLPRRRLEDLLERAEENGRQHIFFYAPASTSAQRALDSFKGIEAVLLNGRTRQEAGLPRFQVEPRDIAVADLRSDVREGSRYSAWVYKLYAGAERWVLAGEPVVEGDEKTVRYKRKYRRDVLVVKWHSFGLLEVRVPIGPKQHLVTSRDYLTDAVAGALEELGVPNSTATTADAGADGAPGTPLHLAPLHLSKATAALDELARASDVKWISVSETELDVDGVKFTLGVDDEYDSIYANKAVSGLVASAKKSDGKTARLRVSFHLRRGTEDAEKFNVELCGSFGNEVRIGARTSPEAVEFMVRRIWERMRVADLPESPVDAMGSDEPVRSDFLGAGFDDFASRHPALAAAVRRLQEWVTEHPTASYVTPEQLRKALGTGLTNYDVAAAVGKFVEEGLLTCKYRVRSRKSRRLSPQIFESVRQLVEQGAADEQGEQIDLKNADVIPVYMPAGSQPGPTIDGEHVDGNGSPRKAAG